MTANDLINIFLRLEMGQKGDDADIAFDTGKDGISPFAITGVRLDEDGDICLESDERATESLTPRQISEAVAQYDGNKTIYFLSIDASGQAELYNIKDGGTKDRHSEQLKYIQAKQLLDLLQTLPQEVTFHFESGTINFTINSVYTDAEGCLCLESNEIEELDNYPVQMIVEELQAVDPQTNVYFYDDEAREYYGIYPDECHIGPEGEVWINVR